MQGKELRPVYLGALWGGPAFHILFLLIFSIFSELYAWFVFFLRAKGGEKQISPISDLRVPFASNKGGHKYILLHFAFLIYRLYQHT